jgi:RimJ/RimL family protein N-acetyltransferase
VTAAATERLRFAEVTENDLDDLLAIHAGNPEYAALTEGSQGEAGYYDLQMLERDWWLGTQEPSREQLIGRLEDGTAAVWLDLLDANPNDGHPWIGLLMVERELQGRGLGREAAGAAERLLAGGPAVRAGVIPANAGALAFWQRLGYAEVERRGGVIVIEAPVSSSHGE